MPVWVAVWVSVALIPAALLVLAVLGMCRSAAQGDRWNEAAVARARVERRRSSYVPHDPYDRYSPYDR